jgi:hypothetical protein
LAAAKTDADKAAIGKAAQDEMKAIQDETTGAARRGIRKRRGAVVLFRDQLKRDRECRVRPREFFP